MVKLELNVNTDQYRIRIYNLHSVEVVSTISVGVTVTCPPPPLLDPSTDGEIEAELEDKYDTMDAPTAPGTLVVPETELSSVQFVPS